MISVSHRTAGGFRRRSASIAVVAAICLGMFGLSGCAAIRAAKKAIDTAKQNKATMDAFTNKIATGPTTFEATYVTSGSSPATVVYAVQPSIGLYFSLTQTAKGSSGTNVHFVVNKSGEYACTPPSSSSAKWACTELPKASAADYQNIVDFYTPTHWVTFLNDFALAAGFAGDKVTDSSTSVNGFSMSCVDFTPPGSGTSLVCTTAQNILGYVKVTGDSTSFAITKYSTSPPASAFQLPAGATITKVSTTTTPTT